MTDCWVDTATYADLLACVFSTFLGWMPETTPCSWVFRCFSLLAWSCMLFLIPCVCFQSASIKSLWPAFRTPHGSQDVQFLFAKLGTAKPGVLNYARNAHRSEVLIFRFSCFPVLYVLYDIYLCYFSFSGFISWWFGVLIRPVFNFCTGKWVFRPLFWCDCGVCGGPRRPKKENPWKCDARFLFYFFPISTSFLHFFLDLSVRNYFGLEHLTRQCNRQLVAPLAAPDPCPSWSMSNLSGETPRSGKELLQHMARS